MVDPAFCDEPCVCFLDLSTGKVVAPDSEEEVDELSGDPKHLFLPTDLFEDLSYGSLDEFVDSLPDDPLRGRLENAIRGKGAFRRFKDIVFGEGNVELIQCAPGIRQACEAQHCGKRTYLYDDLQNLRLDPALITATPLELWPEIITRAEFPDDVQSQLVAPLRGISRETRISNAKTQ